MTHTVFVQKITKMLDDLMRDGMNEEMMSLAEIVAIWNGVDQIC